MFLERPPSKMHGAIPTIHKHLEKIAFSDCCSNILPRNRNNQDIFPVPSKHLLRNGGSEAIPRNQETQRAATVSIFKLFAEDHEFILPGLPAPVLTFGENKRRLASQTRIITIVQDGKIDLLGGGADTAGD
jgi:hypothetical protein